MRLFIMLLCILVLLMACRSHSIGVRMNELEALSPDDDGDGVKNLGDNCMSVPNPDQADRNQDGLGDACHCDTDRNEQVNIDDVRTITAQLNADAGPLDIYDPNADVDGDGIITQADVELCIAACTTNCSP